MNILAYLLSFFIIGMTPAAFAETHGGVHIHLRNGEDIEDREAAQTPDFCMELKPWYHCQHYDEYEEIEEQAERLPAHYEPLWAPMGEINVAEWIAEEIHLALPLAPCHDPVCVDFDTGEGQLQS